MAERLARIARESDPEKNEFLSTARAKFFRSQLEGVLSAHDERDARMRLGVALLRGGESDAAAEEFAKVRKLGEKLTTPNAPRIRWLADTFSGLAYLRVGEQENCVARHTSHSCLMPIAKAGQHTVERGSRLAIEHLTRALEHLPSDPSAAWLLNIAYMTLGEYPNGVPERWRIPPTAFDSSHDPGRFVDVAPAVGLATVGLAGGSILEDFDGDGLLDAMCSSWGLADQVRYFRNRGDGTFEDRTEAAGLGGIVSGLNMIHADYDNDGDADVFILRGAWLGDEGRHPNSLLRNDGGRFVDVTEEAGLLTLKPTQAAAFGDYNGDGFLDLFIGNETQDGTKYPCELFHNKGDGTFEDVAEECRLAYTGFVKGVAWGDYDNDGRLDLYLSCLDQPNVLFRNAGPDRQAPEAGSDHKTGRKALSPRPWNFVDRTRTAGVAEPRLSFPTWFFDYDNDGHLDLFASGYDWAESASKVAIDYVRGGGPGPRPRLYRNNADGTFTDVTKEAGLWKVLITMGANFGDIDGDGYLDMYLGTGEPDFTALMPNRLFRNNEGETFQDSTTTAGLGHLQKGHGVSFGDVDGDGDQDLYTVLGGAFEGDRFQNALFENPGHGRNWITLRLEGTRANRSAIGARVEIVLKQGRGSWSVHRVVGTGGSFGSSSVQLEVGLDRSKVIEEIRVDWPSSASERSIYRDVPINSTVVLREGDSKAEVVEPKTYMLRKAASTAIHVHATAPNE